MTLCPAAIRRDERGQAIVEFAMVGSVALMLLFGIVEIGRAMYTYHLVSNAARIGSRYAIVRGATCSQTSPSGTCQATSDSIQTYVKSVSPGIDTSQLTVSTTYGTSDGCSDPTFESNLCLVTVTASYNFKFLVPLVSSAAVTMSSTSKMVISQ